MWTWPVQVHVHACWCSCPCPCPYPFSCSYVYVYVYVYFHVHVHIDVQLHDMSSYMYMDMLMYSAWCACYLHVLVHVHLYVHIRACAHAHAHILNSVVPILVYLPEFHIVFSSEFRIFYGILRFREILRKWIASDIVLTSPMELHKTTYTDILVCLFVPWVSMLDVFVQNSVCLCWRSRSTQPLMSCQVSTLFSSCCIKFCLLNSGSDQELQNQGF